MAGETLAIIKNVTYGVIDRGYVALRFDAYVSEGSAALQIREGQEANDILAAAKVTDVHELEGMPCWVEQSPGMIEFKRMFEQ